MKITYAKPLQDLLVLWDRAQKERDPEAQFRLGEILLRLESPSAAKAAAKLLRTAAKQGHADARLALGRCYETGIGVRKNCRAAVHWYQLIDAAIFDYFERHPDPIEEAARKVIRRYDADKEFAAALYEIIENERPEDSFAADLAGAQRGDADAQNRLGHRYEYGRDVGIDREKAVFWYKQSAARGCEAGIHRLAQYYADEKNYREAANWYGRYAALRLAWFHERLQAAQKASQQE